MGIAIESLQTKGPEKIGIDFDGTGVKRQAPARWATAVKELFAKVALSGAALEPIPDMDHTPTAILPRGLKERLSLRLQGSRHAISGVPELLAAKISKGIPVYIISGRDATLIWDQTTRKQADREGIPYLDVLLKPVSPKKGNRGDKRIKISGIDSKAHGIKALGITKFFEDNRKTAVRLAERFPDVEITYIDYGAHIGSRILEKLPNIKVIPAAEWERRRGGEPQLGISATRNSRIRERTSHITTGFAGVVDRTIPGLSPTHLNILGVAMVAAGSALAIRRRGFLSTVLIVAGSCLDAVDGPLARTKAKKDPKSVDFKRGQIYDAIGDRAQEVSGAICRGISAHKRGDKLGELFAFITAVTSTLPSITRAYAETLGKAVPESGKGVLGLIGTRVGRAAGGILATTFPEIKGVRTQAQIDALMSLSNIKTTIDRLGAAKNAEITLPSEIREDAKNRLKALGAFGALAIGASLFTYWRLNRQQLQEKPLLSDHEYEVILRMVEQYCRKHDLDHRFVGGTLTDSIGPQTKFNIDVQSKEVTLINPEPLNPTRPDKTVKDIDLVVFTPDETRFKRAREAFEDWRKRYIAQGISIPFISIEAAKHPDWSRRNPLTQFVTSFEKDQDGQPQLVFGSTKQAIDPESLEPWKVNLGNGLRITTLNPVAHALCYALRVPSGVKKKDKAIIGDRESCYGQFNKMGLVGRLAAETRKAGQEQGLDYHGRHKGW